MHTILFSINSVPDKECFFIRYIDLVNDLRDENCFAFNEKVRKGVDGRRDSLKNVQQAFAKDDKVIWMHAASS